MKSLNKTIRVMMLLTISVIIMMAMTSFAFAAETGHVGVSITKDNFNTSGQYVGGGTPATTDGVTLTNVAVNTDTLNYYISHYGLKESFYLPADVDDPMDGDASILDAICLACFFNNVNSISAGWDSVSNPNGGYINNIGNYDVTNTVTYYEGANHNKWGRSTGSGWQIAYKPYGSTTFITANSYYSNVAIDDRMDIIIDYSPYDMTWDTGEPWVE